jgi:predicted RecB family nuclease
MKSTISKHDWLTAIDCLAKGWFQLRDGSAPPNEAERFRMEQGTHVGVLAHDLFPDGLIINASDDDTAIAVTQELIADQVTSAFFEAAFQFDQLVTKADILIREGDGCHVLEVKSSFSDSKSINEYTHDLAYTSMVIELCGLTVTESSLVLLNREYRYGDDLTNLFEIADKTAEVKRVVAEFTGVREELVSALYQDDLPEPSLDSPCRSCAYFEADCLGAGIEYTVLDIPNLHHTKLNRLSVSNIVELKDFPDEIEISVAQDRARYSMLNNEAYTGDGLQEELNRIAWPCYYLDFETVATVLPLYEGHGCHQQVLTQFSLHSRASVDGKLEHYEYLADASKDCQRELTENLITVLGDQGAIVVYSSFEEKRIEAMAELYPDLAGALNSIIDRLVDLLVIVREHVYHPQFRGSYSIKKVLPALVPDLSYEGLDIGDGNTAITMFAKMASGEVEDTEQVRNDLLAYCELDTLAMVRLHDVLLDYRQSPTTT